MRGHSLVDSLEARRGCRKRLRSMTERQIENRVKKLKALESQKAELESQIEAVKEELRTDMQQKGIEVQQAGSFFVRFTKVFTNRFDSKRFKADMPELYKQYTRQTESFRFSIA